MSGPLHGAILVTGGEGFLGKFIVQKLTVLGRKIHVARRSECDLRDPIQVSRLFELVKPAIVVHAAAHGGGIGYMQRNPADVYFDNIMMNTLVLHEATRHHVKKFISIGTVCAYPKFGTIPFCEGEIWNGYPEETNGAYGLAKKMMLVQLEAYRAQYQLRGFQLLLSNLYGPGDSFHPSRSHVIPDVIRKLVEAKETGQSGVTFWGSGLASREFLFVADAAEAVSMALIRYEGHEPVNVGVGEEIAIRDLVTLVQEEIGFDGKIRWDTTKPDGQPRRCLDVSRARKFFGFQARTPLRKGLKQTIDWFLAHREQHAYSA